MLSETVAIILILMFAVILHEYAHGWVANQLGDSTAKIMGRLSLNPLKHIDPLGTILLPTILLLMRSMGYGTVIFGWAKPVPVNYFNLHHPKRDMIWVGLAGPAVNIILAILFSQLLKSQWAVGYEEVCVAGVFINLLLAIFNMIPIPPLDGSRLVMGILPNELARPYMRLEPYGILIVLLLLSSGFLDIFILPLISASARLLGVEL